MSRDPSFNNPSELDFSIISDSPCIDAGDPEINDPDGTISDIGAIYFNQSESNSINVNFFNGWNIVGLPLNPYNHSVSSVYPTSTENSLYLFEDGGYQLVNQLEIGSGYWLHFSEHGNNNIIGDLVDSFTIDLIQGWNIISGISFPVNVESIIDVDNLIINGSIYGFIDGGYNSSDLIEPGKGYWVRSNGMGQIILNQ
jgi:hypothetical protein